MKNISIDADKVVDKIQDPLIMQSMKKFCI